MYHTIVDGTLVKQKCEDTVTTWLKCPILFNLIKKISSFLDFHVSFWAICQQAVRKEKQKEEKKRDPYMSVKSHCCKTRLHY